MNIGKETVMETNTKHLFAISLAEDKKNEYLNDTPFTTVRISPATREAREKGTKEFTKAMMKSLHLPALLIGYLLIALGAAVLLAFLKALPDTDFMTALQNGIWLLIGGGISVAIGACLLHFALKQSSNPGSPTQNDFRKEVVFFCCLHEAAGARHCCVVHGLLMQASHPRTPHHCMSSPHANELLISCSSCSS